MAAPPYFVVDEPENIRVPKLNRDHDRFGVNIGQLVIDGGNAEWGGTGWQLDCGDDATGVTSPLLIIEGGEA